MAIKYNLLMLLLVITLINDILTHKIKNKVIFPFLLAGLIINGYLLGLQGFGEALLASLIPILFLGVFFILNILGAGDIKLFSAIGAIMGINFVLRCLLYSTLVGGIIAALFMLFRHNAKARFRYLFEYLRHCVLTRSFPPYSAFTAGYDESRFPFTYAVATGTMIALLLI